MRTRSSILTLCAASLGCAAATAPCPRIEPKQVAVASPDAGSSQDTVERSVSSDRVTYVFRASALANLLYQLDCMSGVTRCSRLAFEAMWTRDLGLDQPDKDALATWRAIHFRYHGKIERGDETKPPLPLPERHRTVQAGMRVAGYGARDLDDLGTRLSLFADAPDVDASRAIVLRFRLRFERFWVSRKTDLSSAIDGYVKLASRADLRAIADAVAGFYEPELPKGAAQIFELIARPKHDSPDRGEQLDTYALIEVEPDELPEHRYDVIMHELFHAWFAAAAYDRKLALANRFLASGDASAVPAWGLLDEVLATAFGNGVVDRAVDRADFDKRITRKNGFYDDPYIDGVSKVMLPKLEARLAAKKTLWEDDFVPEYLRAMGEAFPRGLPPVAHLQPLVCAYDATVRAAYDHLTELSRSHQTVSSDGLDDAETRALFADRPMWGSAILVPLAKLGSLDGWGAVLDKPTLNAIRTQAAKKKPFVFTHLRKNAGVLFVFVAPDDASMQALEDRFAKLEDLREGIAE